MSTSNPHFFLIDVFAKKPLSGNPLAVVTDAEKLGDSLMKKIAREFNQSETTFILPSSKENVHYRLRSFTPDGSEVFGAGHNALGAWWWLADSGRLELSNGINTFVQEIGQHQLPVDVVFKDGRLSEVAMMQTSPTFELPINNIEYYHQLANALGLKREELRVTNLPLQVVSTGAEHLLVPIQSQSAVSKINPKAEKLAHLLHQVNAQGCYVFCLETIESHNTAHARFFNPTVGIREDAATGSAAGPLACYLTKHGIVTDGTPVIIEQGYQMERLSLIKVKASGNQVRLSGKAVTTAKGELFL